MDSLLNHLIVEGLLVVLLILSEVRNHVERKSLLNRLMARDLPEYATFKNDERRVKIPSTIPKEEIIPL